MLEEALVQILFVGFAITPYYRDFLNRLQSQGGVKVANVRPTGENRHIGAGVHQDFSGIGFSDLQLEERSIAPRRILGLADFETAPGCNSFEGLGELITNLHPDVIVINVNYHAAFRFDREVVTAVQRVRAKVVLHSIPFQLSTFSEAVNALEIPDGLPMRSVPSPVRFLVKALGLDKTYLKFVRRRAMIRRLDFLRTVFNTADAHAVYHEGGIDVYGSYGVPSERIHVVRNSPNTEKLLNAAARHPHTDNGCQLIHIGRLVEWKRVDMLIRSVARLRIQGFPNTGLVVIGYGPCEGSLRELARKLHVEDAIHFRGGLYEPDDLAKEFAASSIYVMAGMGGLSINEAMCFGVPVVCSRGDGTEKFLVREGISGMYFREGDEDSLVETLHKLFSDEQLRQRLVAESRRIIVEELNTQIHVSNYLKLFDVLAQKQGSR